MALSHEGIYHDILKDQKRGRMRAWHRRCPKRRRKRYGASDRRLTPGQPVWRDERGAATEHALRSVATGSTRPWFP